MLGQSKPKTRGSPILSYGKEVRKDVLQMFTPAGQQQSCERSKSLKGAVFCQSEWGRLMCFIPDFQAVSWNWGCFSCALRWPHLASPSRTLGSLPSNIYCAFHSCRVVAWPWLPNFLSSQLGPALMTRAKLTNMGAHFPFNELARVRRKTGVQKHPHLET